MVQRKIPNLDFIGPHDKSRTPRNEIIVPFLVGEVNNQFKIVREGSVSLNLLALFPDGDVNSINSRELVLIKDICVRQYPLPLSQHKLELGQFYVKIRYPLAVPVVHFTLRVFQCFPSRGWVLPVINGFVKSIEATRGVVDLYLSNDPENASIISILLEDGPLWGLYQNN